ncbi:hypothetical protein ON010_g141 [Phytophthora cinnamomi]|nr:hypothetical protein ON010_g141 [Phytophthora cinnamomi]
MQQGEGDSVDARSEDGREVEAFKLPLSEENVALGRLGRIYKALDRKSGRMLAVECIDVVDESEDEGEENSPAEFVQQTLATELGRCLGVINGDNARHVFCYDAYGISCGGLSLSSLLLCGGNIVKIAAWFPSTQAVRAFQTRNLPLGIDEMAQDVRSVAYVMLEMLTGLRARGSLMEKCNLLTKVAAESLEYQVLRSLLELQSLEEILKHPYFSPVNYANSNTIQSSAQETHEQRHIIGILTKQELTKCQTMKRQYLQQVRAWQAQFEKKYRRKPNPADRPTGIVRLQGRCLALNERIQELNDRLAAAHGSIYRLISDKEGLAIDVTSQRVAGEQDDSPGQLKNTEGPTSTSSIESDGSRLDSFGRGGGKRSPAQKAFLNRFGSEQ